MAECSLNRIQTPPGKVVDEPDEAAEKPEEDRSHNVDWDAAANEDEGEVNTLPHRAAV